jgi:hypothetical protein
VRTAVLSLPVAAAILAIATADSHAEKARDGGTPRDASAAIPPDPPPIDERFQWVFDLRWERGEVYLLEVRRIDTGGAHPTPRVMGRFALELYEGPTLIERARFDFPMLGSAESADGGFRAPPRFEPKLKTRIGVLFPDTRRGTRLELWDRAQNRRWPLPWPPREGVFSESDSGAPAVR